MDTTINEFNGSGNDGRSAEQRTSGHCLCTTVWTRTESMSERQRRLQDLRNAANVWVLRATRSRLRKTTERRCTRILCERQLTEHYTVVTSLGRVKRKCVEDRRRTVYHRSVGKFRTVLRLKKTADGEKSIPIVDGIGLPNDQVVLSNGERVHYSDVIVPKRDVRNRRRSMAASRGGGKKMTRTRRMVDLNRFKMFETDGVRNGNTEMVKEWKGNRNSDEFTEEGRTERDKFCRSLEVAYSCTDFLNRGWTDVPFLRFCGGRRRRQKYVCVTTVRLKRMLMNGRTVTSNMVNLIIEEESRKIRNICARREIDDVGCGRISGDEVTTKYLCSCHANWTNDGLGESTCWHVECVKENRLLVTKIESMLCSAEEEGSGLYFGSELCFKETEVMGSKQLVQQVQGEDGESEPCNGMIPIQMDNLTKDELLKRGSTVAKRWSLWTVIDAVERNVVAVLWRPVSSGIAATRMTCVLCRTEASRLCGHEISCEKESELACGEGHGCGDSLNDGHSGDDSSESESEYSADGEEQVNRGMNVIDSGAAGGMTEMIEVPNAEAGPGRGDGGSPGNVKATNKAKDYYWVRVTRGFSICEEEKRLSQNLCELIESEVAGDGSLMFGDPDGAKCAGKYRDDRQCLKQCSAVRKQLDSDKPRRVTLFTLNHGPVHIIQLDWVCGRCGYLNYYRGNEHGIIPSRHGVSFTVELMYWWLHEMCSNTNSFRAVYATVTKLHCTPTYSCRFTSGRLRKLQSIHKPNRRTANEAIRKFISCIDIDSKNVSTQLYSCNKCEVDLEDSDRRQLGLDEEQSRGRKRLKGVVVDGKVVALLKKLGHTSDNHDVLRNAAGLSTRVVSNRETQNCIRMFLKLTRGILAAIRSRTILSDVSCEDSGPNRRFVLDDGICYVRVAALLAHGTTKAQKRTSKLGNYVSTIRASIDPNCCLCSGTERSTERDHAQCNYIRRKVCSTGGHNACRQVFRFLFELDDGFRRASGRSGDVEPTGASEDNGGNDGDSQNDSDDGNDHVDADLWVRFKHVQVLGIEKQLDSFLETSSFCLVEPLSLGFFPYQTEVDNTTSRYSSAASNVYHGVTRNSSETEVRNAVLQLSSETVTMHRDIAEALDRVGTCDHEGRTERDWACSQCNTPLNDLFNSCTLQSPVIGRFLREVFRGGHRNALFTRSMSTCMSALLRRRVQDFERYMKDLSKKLDPSCIEYWKRFGSVANIEHSVAITRRTNGRRSRTKSLFVFPGRDRVRNPIDFDGIDKQDCSKVYFKGKTPVPTFLTVQCCCAHPKLLGFVLIRQCESISAALSSVLTHFVIPPRRVWYDNACNSFDSAIMRLPWFLRYTMFIVDRFHYNGHTCCNVFNGDMHRFLDADRSVAAEVINAIIDKGTNHITYLKGDNVIPFMKVLFAHVNATAHVRDRIIKKDLEDEDLVERFRQYYKCFCTLCVEKRNGITAIRIAQNGYRDGISVFSRDNIQVTFHDEVHEYDVQSEQFHSQNEHSESDDDDDITADGDDDSDEADSDLE